MAVAVPLLIPTAVWAVAMALSEIGVGCATVAVAKVVQPAASVTVTKYVPAGNPVMDAEVALLLQR